MLVLGALTVVGCSTEEASAPNVLVLVIDTLRADRLSMYGHDRETSPFLDQLASRGVVFERAWSTSSWTAPSTASIFTGLYPNQHGLTQGLKLVQSVQQDKQPTLVLNRIPGAIETLPELMRSRGYRTFGVADNPNICEEEGFTSGFDRFQNFDIRDAPAVHATLEGWADEIRSGSPWFVYLQYADPHYPYVPRTPWVEQHRERVGGGSAREQAIGQLHAVYDSEINFSDDYIRKACELIGVDEETVVIVLADHGEELMQRSDDLQHEFKLYSELTQVPLILVHPGVDRVRERVGHTVSIIDVLPTIRQIIGAPASKIDSGQSLVPYYAAANPPNDDRTVYSMREQLEVLGGQKIWAVIRQNDKLIVHESSKGSLNELYDLKADWPELNNLAEEKTGLTDELLSSLEDMRTSASRFDPEQIEMTLSAEDAQRIHDIGYTGDEDEPEKRE